MYISTASCLLRAAVGEFALDATLFNSGAWATTNLHAHLSPILKLCWLHFGQPHVVLLRTLIVGMETPVYHTNFGGNPASISECATPI